MNMTFTGTFNLADRHLYTDLLVNRKGRGPRTSIGDIIATYAIVNTFTGKAYVGSTSEFAVRWGNHLFHLNRGTHRNVLLQEAFDEDGIDAFTIELLSHYETTDDLIEHEVTDGLVFRSLDQLYNGRLGTIFIPGYPFAQRNRHATRRPGIQQNRRWFDGQRLLAA